MLRAPASAAAAGVVGYGGGANQPVGKAADSPGGIWEKPPDQRSRGNRLNLILLDVDTFRADNLLCYGGTWIDCPNLNQFAQDCIIFENAYPEALPTVPIRRNLMTGRRILPFDYYQQHEPVQMPG